MAHFAEYAAALSQWETAVIMSALIQSKSTIDADQPVTVRLVFMWVNQCIHQRHAELADPAAPTFRFSKAPYRPELLFSRTHARTLAHACIDSLPSQK